MQYKPLDDYKASAVAQWSRVNLRGLMGDEIRQMAEQCRRANRLAALVEHALKLGYLGEGSTAGWAREALATYLGEEARGE